VYSPFFEIMYPGLSISVYSFYIFCAFSFFPLSALGRIPLKEQEN